MCCAGVFRISSYHIIDNNNIAHNATIDNLLNLFQV